MPPRSQDPARPPAMLIALGGLPGTGKTTIGRELARGLTAVFLQVDRIEQALRSAGWPVEGEEYCVAEVIAEDNLRLGRIVVADAINPWPQNRAAWRAVAERTGVRMLAVEVVCSDPQERKRRVSTRVGGPRREIWQDGADDVYSACAGEGFVVDTARLTVEQCVSAILADACDAQEGHRCRSRRSPI